VGVSAQGGATQVLNAKGRPVGPVTSWLDGRGRGYVEAFRRELPEEAAPRLRGAGVGHLLRIRAEEPERLRPPFGVGFVGDVVVGRLCGRRAHDITSAALALPLLQDLSGVDLDVMARLDVGQRELPDLLPPRTPAGALLPEAAELTCLPAGIPVSAAVHDQYAAALGCGAVRPGDVMFGAGTAWVLLAVSERATPGARGVCRHLVEGLYGHLTSMVNGGSAFGWAVELFGLQGRGTEELDDLLESAPAGADGVRFRPHLASGGARLARGSAGRLDGLRLAHEGRHVLRAVVEGLAFELARYLRFWTDAGMRVERLVMCGRAAASRVTPQVVAEATRTPVDCCSEPDTSAFGAAILARGLVEPDAGLDELARQMAPDVRSFEPGPLSGLYRELASEYAASLPTSQ